MKLRILPPLSIQSFSTKSPAPPLGDRSPITSVAVPLRSSFPRVTQAFAGPSLAMVPFDKKSGRPNNTNALASSGGVMGVLNRGYQLYDFARWSNWSTASFACKNSESTFGFFNRSRCKLGRRQLNVPDAVSVPPSVTLSLELIPGAFSRANWARSRGGSPAKYVDKRTVQTILNLAILSVHYRHESNTFTGICRRKSRNRNCEELPIWNRGNM